MGVIVLFAVVNTMTMNVMERTNEIGTIRAMGVRRSGIRRQFLVEGSMLGAIGATVGVVLAVRSSSVGGQPCRADLDAARQCQSRFRCGSISSAARCCSPAPGSASCWWRRSPRCIPANRAARLPVVDALRHV